MPLQVRASFSTLPRRSVSYIGGDPVDLLDYRTIPVIIPDGNTTASVSEVYLLLHEFHCAFCSGHTFNWLRHDWRDRNLSS